MAAFAVEWLTKLFGSDVAAAVKKTSATRWNAAPFIARRDVGRQSPGAQPSRKILTEPIGCMFLAGEATHETLWGTVDGAWESGERAADAALRKIGALKDDRTRRGAGAAAKRRRRAAPARYGGAVVADQLIPGSVEEERDASDYTGSASCIRSLATMMRPLKFFFTPRCSSRRR